MEPLGDCAQNSKCVGGTWQVGQSWLSHRPEQPNAMSTFRDCCEMQDGASWEPVGLEGEVRSEALSLSGETKYMIEVYDYHCHFLWNDRASHAAPGPTSSEDMLFLLDLPSLPTSHYQLFPLYTGCCWVPCQSLLPSPSSWTEPCLSVCVSLHSPTFCVLNFG